MSENQPLFFTTEQIMKIDCWDFSEFVSSRYGFDFDFTSDQEVISDSSYEFNISKGYQEPEGVLRGSRAKELRNFKISGDGYMMTESILQELVDDGLLPEGLVIIKVSFP
jgi:hypothetical protein